MITTYFKNIKDTIIKEVSIAEKSIFIAMYYLTDKEIIDIIVEKIKLGVKVFILLDDNSKNLSIQEKYPEIGSSILLYKHQMLHSKFCIIDNNTVITGSYNWSNKAKNNIENIIIIKKDTKIVNKYLKEFEKLKNQILKGNKVEVKYTSIQNKLREKIEEIEIISKMKDVLVGVPSGFLCIDRLTMGWQRSELIAIAGRYSMGKTSFMLTSAYNIAVRSDAKIAIFSPEMSSEKLIDRFILMTTQIPLNKIKTGILEDFEWIQLEEKSKILDKLNLYIDDTPKISISEIKRKSRLYYKEGINMIFIDNLQLITNEGKENRGEELGSIVRELKGLAMELNIPIIIISELNRSVETRNGDKRPQLIDIKGTGELENVADLILFINRPEEYGMTEDEEGNSTEQLAEIIIAKHRNGETADVQLQFIKEFAVFQEFEENVSDSVENIMFDKEVNKGGDPFSLNTDFDNDNAPF